jgi:hypothetical protein
MRELRHPLTFGIYGLDPDNGFVRVEQDGRIGFFDFRGQWQGGEQFQVDPEFCNWVGGPGGEGGSYSKGFKTV